jgi:HEAT repeat protein
MGAYNFMVGKFIGFLALLASLAVGAAWYFMRARPTPAPPPSVTAGVDTSWMSDLYSQNPKDIERGTGKVTSLGTKVLPQIQATLRNTSAQHEHRRAALRACGILGPAAGPALPEVSAALENPELTTDAAAAMSFMGPQAFPPLAKSLESENPAVRRESLRSIGKLRFRAPLESREVMPLLLDAMVDTDEGVRAVAATYLGIIHEDPTAAVPLLAQALQDPDVTVRRASATALGSFGSQAAEAVPALRKAAADQQDPDLAREAGRAIVAVSGTK